MSRNPHVRRPHPGLAGRGHGHNRNTNPKSNFPSRNQSAGNKDNNNKPWSKPNQSSGFGNQNIRNGFNGNPRRRPNQSSGFGNQNGGKGFNSNPWKKPHQPSGFGDQNVGKGFHNNKRQNRPQNLFIGKGGGRQGFNQGNQSPRDVDMEDVVTTPWGFGNFAKMNISSPIPRWGRPRSPAKHTAWAPSKDVSVSNLSMSRVNAFQKAHLNDKTVEVRFEGQHLSLNNCYEVQVTQTVAVYKLGGHQEEIRTLDFPNLKEKRYEHLLARRKVIPRRKAFGKRKAGNRPRDTRRIGVPPYRTYKALTKKVDTPKNRVFKKYRFWRKRVRPNQKVFAVVL